MAILIPASKAKKLSTYTKITQSGESEDDTGISFGLLNLERGEVYSTTSTEEMAFLHMSGAVCFRMGNQVVNNTRTSLFDELPFAVHIPKDIEIEIHALSNIEIAIFSTPNMTDFKPVIHFPEEISNEHRGKGLVNDACYRFVRTIFDDNNTDPNSQLVLGEVINMPGCWSSYPPHHHSHPEIYHYRFTEPQGYGHAELGDSVYKVRHKDTVKILNNVDHSQCSAPGYGMYYLWVIKHLPNDRYILPEFNEEHKWTLLPDALFWTPKEEAFV